MPISQAVPAQDLQPSARPNAGSQADEPGAFRARLDAAQKPLEEQATRPTDEKSVAIPKKSDKTPKDASKNAHVDPNSETEDTAQDANLNVAHAPVSPAPVLIDPKPLSMISHNSITRDAMRDTKPETGEAMTQSQDKGISTTAQLRTQVLHQETQVRESFQRQVEARAETNQQISSSSAVQANAVPAHQATSMSNRAAGSAAVSTGFAERSYQRNTTTKDLTDPTEFVKHLHLSRAVATQTLSRNQEFSNVTWNNTGEEAQNSAPFVSSSSSITETVALKQNTAPTSTPFYKIDVPLTHDGWSKAISQQVLHFMTRQSHGDQMALIRLDPPELGPIRVEIRIDESGTTQAMFTSANAQVRQALEQALPDLQRNMSTAGFTLSDADVSDQSSSEWDNNQDHGHERPARQSEQAHQTLIRDSDVQHGGSIATPHEGLISTFA